MELPIEIHVSAFGDTSRNLEIMEIVKIMEKQLPSIMYMGDELLSIPFLSGPSHVGQDTMMHIETSGIEMNLENLGNNLIGVPITYEEENVEKNNALDDFDTLTNNPSPPNNTWDYTNNPGQRT